MMIKGLLLLNINVYNRICNIKGGMRLWYNAPINGEIIRFIQAFSNPFLDNVFVSITMLGEEYFFIIALSLIYWCIDKNMGYRIGFTYLSSMVLNAGIKEVLQVPRPIGETGIRSLRIETATGSSFPSGHTQGVATFWISLMTNTKKSWTYILGSIIILMVALSRIYLGVHRPVDVVGSIVIAAVWVFIVNMIFDYIKTGGNKAILLLTIIPMVICAVILKDADYYKALGVSIGFFIGYIIEPKYINFNVRAGLLKQVFKLFLGLSVAIAIKVLTKLILPETLLGDLIRYIIIGLWITLGATYIFDRLFRNRNIFNSVSK
jgi:membrane-associated phospholipid phosphatase